MLKGKGRHIGEYIFCHKRRNQRMDQKKEETAQITRRDFLQLAGKAGIAAGVGSLLPDLIWLDNAVAAIPASEGYLLVDTKKCQGCMSCMLACSLVHEGVENLTLSRIQVIQNSFEGFPDDLTLEQCRQCVDPACVEACPEGALYVDKKHGNVRRIDKKKCIGCRSCIEACPYTPSRAVWHSRGKYAQKCDLCADAPYHWDEGGGGPKGKQACVEVCPVGAIEVTDRIPLQQGDGGYKVDLRGSSWRRLGYPS